MIMLYLINGAKLMRMNAHWNKKLEEVIIPDRKKCFGMDLHA